MFSKLREDIAVVFERDPAARSMWEILTTYPGVHAILIHRLSARLWRCETSSGWHVSSHTSRAG